MAAIEEIVIKYTAQELPLLLREIMRIPTCHLSQKVPPWEAQKLLEMAAFLEIDTDEYVSKDENGKEYMTYDNAVILKRKIMAALGDIFRDKGELGKTRLDELRELAGL